MQKKHNVHFKIWFSFLSKVKSDLRGWMIDEPHRHKVQTNYALLFFGLIIYRKV